MADPLSKPNGVIALATFALESSVKLSTTIRDSQNQDLEVLALKLELEDLTAVLQSLLETANSHPDNDFDALKMLLHHCGNANKEYGAFISRFAERSTKSHSTVRDWVTQKYLREDINNIKHILTSYKTTINIALAKAHIRIAAITPKTFEDDDNSINHATYNVEQRLRNIDSKIQRASVLNESDSGHNNIEWQAIMQEKRTTQQCLNICAQLSSKMDQLGLPRYRSQFVDQPSALIYVKDGLDVTRSTIQTLSSQLQKYEVAIDKRMESMPSEVPLSAKTTMEFVHPLEKKTGGRNWDAAYIPAANYIVPFGINPDFVGRAELLMKLKAELNPTRPTSGTSQTRVSLQGLGGVGKTQIALEFVRWVHKNHPTTSILWVDACNADRFRQGYLRIAEEFQIPGHDDVKFDVLPLVKSWLEEKHRGRWLMVIDDANDSQLSVGERADSTATYSIQSKSKGELANYLPNCSYGDILTTTRSREVSLMLTSGRQPIKVVSMSANDSEHLLRTKLKGIDSTSNDLITLASQLEHLPLALTQAAAFIKRSSITVREYLHLLGRSEESLVNLLSPQSESARRDSETFQTVAKTWIISLQHLEIQDAPASELLFFMSIFDAQGIPIELLSRYREQEIAEAHRSGEIELTKMLSTLTSYSFVAEEANGSFAMHQLVQWMARKWLISKGTISQFRRQALAAISHIFPYGTFETRATCAELLPHANAVLDLEGSPSRHEMKARALLLYSMAGYFGFEGKWSQAERLSLEASRLQNELWGSEHPSTLMSMATLASTYRNQGRWNEAEKIGVRVMNTWEKLRGPDDLTTLASMATLASIYRDQGRWNETETLEVHVMETCMAKLGLDHPNTLTSMGNLASTYRNQGRWDEAEALEVETLKTLKMKLGDDHPSTLSSMTNLASIYRNRSQWVEAETLEVQVFEASKMKLGPNHPYTLTSIANLSMIYKDQGRLEEAESLGLKLVGTRKTMLGENHPDTLTSMANLASIYRDQGRLEEAESLGLKLVGTRKTMLGENHPDTLTSMANLASIYRDQGRLEEAESLGLKLVGTRTTMLGENHPDTLMSTDFLTSLYASQRRQDEGDLFWVKIRNMTQRITDAEHLPSASDGQPMNPDRDSAYASASRIETLPVLLEPPFEAITKPFTVQDQGDSGSLFEEVHSIDSDNDDIGSQTSNEITMEGMTGKALIRVFLAEESQFRALCQKALANISRRRFVSNMRKLLRLFYKDLMAEAQNEAENAVARLLRSRRGRLRISDQLADFINEREEDWESSRANREVDLEDKHRIETWLSHVAKPVGQEQKLDDQDKDELLTSTSDDDLQSNSFPFTSELEVFLRNSKSLRKLKENFMLAFLPPGLKHVLLSIPRQLIWVSHVRDVSFSDRVKAWVERSTQTKWNWWPLKPPKRILQAGEARVFWKCTCGSEQWEEVSVDQAGFVDHMIANSDQRPMANHGCIIKGEGVVSTTWLRGILRQLRPAQSMPLTTSNYAQSGNSVPGPSSYQFSPPRSVVSAVTSMPSQPSQYQSSAASQQIQMRNPNTAAQIESWILFGVQGASRTIIPAQIPVKSDATDYTIFQELRKWYRLRRGRMRLWFSIWRLEYCDIVKFHRLTVDRMVHDYRELPTQQDYQYEPRPPAADAQNPPIRAHFFQTLFYTCRSPCSRYIPHECNSPQAGRTLLERIPKRTQSFERELASPIWGLETVFEPSLIYVFAYHIAILIGPFVLWGWWLKFHPSDLQNASVPITIVLTGLSLFWSGAGILTRKGTER